MLNRLVEILLNQKKVSFVDNLIQVIKSFKSLPNFNYQEFFSLVKEELKQWMYNKYSFSSILNPLLRDQPKINQVYYLYQIKYHIFAEKTPKRQNLSSFEYMCKKIIKYTMS